MRIVVTTKPRENAAPIVVEPCPIWVQSRPQRVLDFDIENRPLSYLGSDFTTSEVTAIAWAWTDAQSDSGGNLPVTVHLLGETELPDILRAFLAAYTQADLVIGHYIRGHDLPMLNGALMECGLPPLPDKATHDTKLDAMRTKGISLSQESLGAMFRLEQGKVQMNQAKWRAANRLTAEGLAHVRERVVGDVRQHIGVWQYMREHEYLAPPREWKSGSAKQEVYVP